jgi:uncharacterized protein (DUF488 family)
MTEGPRLFSIGHGRRDLASFLAIVLARSVRTLVDVRARPSSRRFPHFAQSPLTDALREAGIEYVWEGEALGGHRAPVRASPHSALGQEAFRGYADHMATRAFRAGAKRLLERGSQECVAFLCAEHFPTDCHRRFLADWLVVHGARVGHAVEIDRTDEHVLHPALRVVDGVFVYDAGRGYQRRLF